MREYRAKGSRGRWTAAEQAAGQAVGQAAGRKLGRPRRDAPAATERLLALGVLLLVTQFQRLRIHFFFLKYGFSYNYPVSGAHNFLNQARFLKKYQFYKIFWQFIVILLLSNSVPSWNSRRTHIRLSHPAPRLRKLFSVFSTLISLCSDLFLSNFS